MFRVDENVDPNIMSKTVLLSCKEGGAVSDNKKEEVESCLVSIINKKRPFDVANNASPLKERRLTVHSTSPMRPLSLSSSPKKFSRLEHDIKMIEAALGGTEQFHVERFEKEHGESLQTIICAVKQEVIALRYLNKKFIGFGGLKQAGLKKWKLLVKLDISGKINELVIGKFKTSGSFTKAYFTLNRKVILVPKKAKSESGMQALHAYSMIASLRNACSANEHHMQQIMPLLPPLPDKHMVDRRPIMVAPQATSTVSKFITAPKDLKDVIDRLGIIHDVAKGLAFCHEKGLVHGDIKPDNLLITQNGIGQLHDFGGSCIFNGNEGNKDALIKYRNISWTPSYNHYQDYLADQHLSKNNASVDNYIQLGRSRDVFTLGVTTIISLIGIYDKDRKRIYPFVPASYYACEHLKTSLPNGNFNSCQDITCLQLMPNQISEKLKKLLKSSLEENYTNRITATAFAEQLDHILTELKATNSQ